MMTRTEYMAMSHTDGMKAHRAYYAQFVKPAITSRVVQCIGAARLLASTDRHMNDIPLVMWGRLVGHLPVATEMSEAGDYLTLGNGVCILKEAARQWVEAQQAKQVQS